jgi:hypothetical protein
MNIADNKRKNNIAEYIIHMYQTEDLMRAYAFDLDRIKNNIINHLPETEQDKKSLTVWYADIISKMKQEGIEASGHLSEVQSIVKELAAIHEELQNTDSNFETVYLASKEHIDKSLEFAKGQLISEVQICLNGVYGLLLLRLNDKKVADDILESISAFGDILSYLSFKYKQKHFMSEN